uniref:Galanin message associated peptide (GMAP) domain-containing protein n=1 Tax=Sinocyclocheilus anshuiensis TaxID=1608454 RepID=A0A671S5D7_9TELE
MHRCVGGVCVSLIVCAFLTETLGMAIAVRGLTAWCSAGCSNDHVIMCGFAFDKHGLAGKREMPISRQVRNMHPALRIADEDIVHTIIDFLSYLKLKGKCSCYLIRDFFIRSMKLK